MPFDVATLAEGLRLFVGVVLAHDADLRVWFVFAQVAGGCDHGDALEGVERQQVLVGVDDSASLLPITARQGALFPGTATIHVLRLADALPAADIAAPALLKLDVQGFELQALAGCEDVLEPFAWVYAECSFQERYAGQSFAGEVIAGFRVRGLRLAGVDHMAHDARGRVVQADFLFGHCGVTSASITAGAPQGRHLWRPALGHAGAL